jgi:hypothetical protein
MIPVYNMSQINSYEEVFGKKWASLLNLDKIDLSALGLEEKV